jgi:hypothetical protein
VAYDTAYLTSPRTGHARSAPLGFSWTMFFFAFFAPLIRGDWKWAGIIFLLACVAAAVSAGFLGWLPGLVGAFMWNKSYLNRLVQDGFQLRATASGNLDRVDGEAGVAVPRLVAEPQGGPR